MPSLYNCSRYYIDQGFPEEGAEEAVKESKSEEEKTSEVKVNEICLPGKCFIPWREVPIEEVTEDFEGFQEGFEVGRRLLVLDAQVDCLLQGLQRHQD